LYPITGEELGCHVSDIRCDAPLPLSDCEAGLAAASVMKVNMPLAAPLAEGVNVTLNGML
jgi:hypothetical protein